MLIGYASKKLQKICEESKTLRKQLPEVKPEQLQLRLGQLAAFRCLKDIPIQGTPLHFHPLTGDLAGHFAVRIDKKYRIVFKACGGYQALADGTPDLGTVTEIEISGIGDYH